MENQRPTISLQTLAIIVVLGALALLWYKQYEQRRQLAIVVNVMRKQQASITNLTTSIAKHNAALHYLTAQQKTNGVVEITIPTKENK